MKQFDICYGLSKPVWDIFTPLVQPFLGFPKRKYIIEEFLQEYYEQ